MLTDARESFRGPSAELAHDASVIRAQRLQAGFRGNPVWGDATFDIERGAFVAVIGPNGAGKTTLFRMLLGLQEPLGGRLDIFGSRPQRGNVRIGYVPQRHSVDIDTHIDCESFVRLSVTGTPWGPGLAGREARVAADTALEAVGAADLARRCVGTLSGGELQRIFLAQALVGDPELLLLDEPLSNLDLRRSRELVALISGLVRSRHVTTLLVAHDINPLIPSLDTVIYIANGRVATGPPSTVLTSESLSSLYGVPVEVLRDSRGNLVIVGGEEGVGGGHG
ncbi:MAG TPA: ATP-binding cassette domain-containing protein [Thermoplasmata archaeon]|nr:ATP-binding cassette domain-containing protein [Thermoplasmata archaeon]